jgi:hypothetical protein
MSLDTRDPALADVRDLFVRVPVVLCVKCRTADYDLDIQWVEGAFVVKGISHQEDYYPAQPRWKVPARWLAIGPRIELDADGWPLLTGIGALSTNNRFMDIRGELRACSGCGKPLVPLFLLAQPVGSRWSQNPDLIWLNSVIFGDLIFPEATAMMIGYCADCRVIGQQIGPF